MTRPLELRVRDGTRAQQPGFLRIAQVNDGGFESDARGAAVEDMGNFFTETLPDMRGGRGADVAKRICARCRERDAGEFQQPTEKWM